MKNNYLICKKYFIYLILFFFFNNLSKAEIIKEFQIIGNDRVSDQTVIMFSKLEVGDQVDNNSLNLALKEIFSTNYFKDVSISINDGIIQISVLENPIIQSISIVGIDKDKIYKTINEVTKKIEKYPFIESQINDQVKLLKNILKSYGYYFVELNSSIQINDNNTIDLKYDFKLGDIAKISKINFIGEKVYRDSTLRNIIVSEETKFWKFLTKNKFLDPNRVNLDVKRIENFYSNRGYFNVKVKSTTAIINNLNQFELTFNINAGKKYFFDDVRIE